MLCLWSCAMACLLPGADARVWPGEVALHGHGATQRLVVGDAIGATLTADRTAHAKFSTSDPKIATVNDEGIVRAAGDGTAAIHVFVGDALIDVPVKVVGAKAAPTPDFVRDIVPVLTRTGCNSGACHGALAGKGGLKLSLRGYAPADDWHALARQALGRRVDLARPDDSLLLAKPTRAMPHAGGKRFESDTEAYRRLKSWIAGGAKPAEGSAPELVGLEVFPPRARLRVKDAMPIVVRARYADGAVEDVTPWARFTSSGESVAGVDEYGQVTVAGPGEVAISVGYRTFVSSLTLTVPYDRPAVSLTGAPRHNFIDDYVYRKLEELRIPPSAPADDRTWVRRAYLDTIGMLPTPDEVDRFVADKTADKRARLAVALVARPEYVDYWSHKWCDVLLLSSRKLPQTELWSFYRFVRSAVAENRPWDRFARDIVAFRGSTLTGGAGNYFVIHKDPAELTEATAVTFLGLSIACARCHNHPLEKWTQDQYWGFANLFGRVALKAGDRAGEVIVLEEPTGDLMHPRRGTAPTPATLDGPTVGDGHDRRAAFGDWLTGAENPFFARAAVNRVWKNYFGRGLVEAEDDFRQSNPPSHPELLDELAARFIRNKYDMRWLVRTILESAAYQRSSVPVPGNEADDRWLSRYIVRRLPAEVILDAYSQLTGIPTDFNEIYSVNREVRKIDQYPLGVRAQQLPDALLVSPFLDSFGRPAREQACSCERQSDSSMTQALHLANGDTLNNKLRAKGSVVEKWLAADYDHRRAVREAFQLALGRSPTEAEEAKLLRDLGAPGADRRAAWEDLLWAVGTSREFLFNH